MTRHGDLNSADEHADAHILGHRPVRQNPRPEASPVLRPLFAQTVSCGHRPSTVSKYANSASDAIPGRSHSGDFPKRSQAQNENQPAISPTDASTYTMAVFID